MKYSKKNQTRISIKQKDDKIKVLKRVGSPTLKCQHLNELKHWKSQKQLSFLKDESYKSLKSQSFLEQDSKEKINSQIDKQVKLTQKKIDKTCFKKNDKISSAHNIHFKTTTKTNKQQKDRTKKNNNPKIREQELINKCQQLQAQNKQISGQNIKYIQKIKSIENQNEQLTKKIDKQNKIISQNKKTFIQKVSLFNKQSQQIKKLKDRIIELQLNFQKSIRQKIQKDKQKLQIGVNTNIQTIQYQSLQMPRQQQNQEEKVQEKTCFSNMIKTIKQLYNKRINQMNNTILQQQQSIISLQKQLNQKYMNQNIYNTNCLSKSNIQQNSQEEKKIIQQIQTISKLEQIINKQNNKIQEIKIQNKNLQVSIHGLRFQVQVLKVRNDQLQNYRLNKIEQQFHQQQSPLIKNKVSQLQNVINHKNEEIQILQSKIFLQQQMIKKSKIKKSIIKK